MSVHGIKPFQAGLKDLLHTTLLDMYHYRLLGIKFTAVCDASTSQPCIPLVSLHVVIDLVTRAKQ